MDKQMTFNGDDEIFQPAEDMGEGGLTAVLEALLFASGDAVSAKKLADAAGVDVKSAKKALAELAKTYKERGGLAIIESESGYQLVTKKEFSDYIDRLFENPRRRGLSNAALEVLAIIALRQPVTRAEIEEMRGTNSDAMVQQLLKKELVYCSGKLDKLGSPSQYSTTEKFLEAFDLSSLSELPPIDDFLLI